MRHHHIVTALAILLPLLASCAGSGNGGRHEPDSIGEPIALTHARNLTLSRHRDFVRADIRNPWDTTKTLHTYILVPDTAETPERLPAGTIVRIPLKRGLVYSSVHNSLICELGAIDAIGGVCDPQYIYQQPLAARIAEGAVADCGNSMTPNLEKTIRLNPDAILLSPFENSGNYGKLGELGIPIIECADYMETTPLGRAEWMKFYGLLFGRQEEASAIFDTTATEYEELRQSVAARAEKPRVLTDRIYGASWNVPAGHSTMGKFIEDAGGVNPFAYIDKSGSAPLSGEQVLHKAGDADIWLIRYSESQDMPLSRLEADNPIYPRIKAFGTGNVYGCNTSQRHYYEEIPFHPQWLLQDLIQIFHPSADSIERRHTYFTRLK